MEDFFYQKLQERNEASMKTIRELVETAHHIENLQKQIQDQLNTLNTKYTKLWKTALAAGWSTKDLKQAGLPAPKTTKKRRTKKPKQTPPQPENNNYNNNYNNDYNNSNY